MVTEVGAALGLGSAAGIVAWGAATGAATATVDILESNIDRMTRRLKTE